MRHLVLPADHAAADIHLAGELMVALRSESLYVAWTLAHGSGAPTVEAVVVEERPPGSGASTRRRGLRTRLGALVRALWHAERRASESAPVDAPAAGSQLSSRPS